MSSAISETLEEETDVLGCDNCKFTTKVAKDLRTHIGNVHAVNIFEKHMIENSKTEAIEDQFTFQDVNNDIQDNSSPVSEEETRSCNKCAEKFVSQKNLENHMKLHYAADNISLAFHKCRACDNLVGEKDLSIQCSKCVHIYHKKCTDKKNSKGNWRTPLWCCNKCTLPTNETLSIQYENLNDHTEEEHTLNPEASVFFPPNTTLPRLTGKHKKSKVNENAENEFLQATIDTLKATLKMD